MRSITSPRIPSLPSRRAAYVILGSALATLGACKTDAPRSSAPARSEVREEPAARRDAPAPTPPAVPPPPAGEGAYGDLMHDHFAIATQVRDAVVRGRLEDAEAPLIWLGQHGAAQSVPATWRTGVERMQRAARTASGAETLATAGRAIALVAAECGACHTALQQGPAFEPSDYNDLRMRPSRRSELRERMHAQLWGIDRLWEGLIGPWEDSWRQGCENLRNPAGHPRVPASQQARLERVRALANTAAGAASAIERAHTYGELLAECGSCHASSGVDPGAFEDQEEVR